MARLASRVLQYIAAEVSRRRYSLDQDVPRKVRRNAVRKFQVALRLDRVVELVEHYQRMYTGAAALLPRYLTPPPRGEYCDWSQVRIAEFIAAIRRTHPGEQLAAVRTVAWYVIHYEYLR